MDENFVNTNPLLNQNEENIPQNTNVNNEEISTTNQPKVKRRKKRNISKTFLFYSPTSFYYQIVELDHYKYRGLQFKGKGFSKKKKDKKEEQKEEQKKEQKEEQKEDNKDEIKEDKNEKSDEEEDNKVVQDNKKEKEEEVKDDDVKNDIKEDNKKEEHLQNEEILNKKKSQNNNVLHQQENPHEQQVNDINKVNKENVVKNDLHEENIPKKEEQEQSKIAPQEQVIPQKEEIKHEEPIVNPSHEEVIRNKNDSEIQQVQQDNNNNDNINLHEENIPSNNNIDIIENQNDDVVKQEPIVEQPSIEQFIQNLQEEPIQENNIVDEQLPENEEPEQQELKQDNKQEPSSSSDNNQSKAKVDRARLLAFRKRANLDKVKLKAIPKEGETEQSQGQGSSFFDNIHMKSVPKDNSDPNQQQQSNFFDTIQMKAVPKNEDTNQERPRAGSIFDTIQMKAVPKNEDTTNKPKAGSFFDTIQMKTVPKNEDSYQDRPRTGSVFEKVHMKAVPQMEIEPQAHRKKSVMEKIKMKEVPKTQTTFEGPKLKAVEKTEVKIELDKIYSYEIVFQTDKNDHVWSICFCPTLLEGKPAIVTGHASGVVYAWDMEKFAKTKTYKEHTSKVYDIKKIFITSAFRQIFVTVSEDHMLKIWESSSERSTISIKAQNPLYTLDIHPSNYIIYGDKEKYLYCQYIDIGGKGQLIKDQNFKSETTHNSHIWRVKVLGKGSLENTYVVSASESSLQIHKLEIKRRKFNLYKEFPEAHNGLIHDIIEIGHDSSGFMTCGIDHCIKLWNVHEDAPIKSIDYLYDDVILSLMELSDENAVVCGGYDKKLKVISKDRLLKEGDEQIKENCEYVRNESMYKLIPIVNDSVFTVASINYGCSENVYLWGSAINYRQKEKEDKKNENEEIKEEAKEDDE